MKLNYFIKYNKIVNCSKFKTYLMRYNIPKQFIYFHIMKSILNILNISIFKFHMFLEIRRFMILKGIKISKSLKIRTFIQYLSIRLPQSITKYFYTINMIKFILLYL